MTQLSLLPVPCSLPALSAGPELSSYDVVLVNTSGGKDSQVMLHAVCAAAEAAGVRDRVVAVHADLGRVEWAGTRDLVERQCAHYGVRLVVVKRPQGDLLDHVEKRGMWPGPATRYCTSDHKRGQIRKVMTQVVRELGLPRRVKLLSCMGLRAEESPKRAKQAAFTVESGGSNKTKRQVDEWLPIQDWTLAQVWAVVKSSGAPYHAAYDLGMPRLSCVFCIFAPKQALLLAGKHNPELLAEYVAVEKRIDHTFKADLALSEVKAELDAGVEPVVTGEWGPQ